MHNNNSIAIEIKDIETKRLICRKFTDKDWNDYVEYNSQREGQVFNAYPTRIRSKAELKKIFLNAKKILHGQLS